jgi:hypothetical protein
MTDALRCANPACGRPVERRPTGRPAAYCGPACRQAARRERLRLAEAERRHAGRLGADRAVPDHRGATQPAVLRARDQAALIPREAAGATAPLVTKQLIARAGRQGPTDGEPAGPASMPVIKDAGDVPGVPAASGTQAPRAWPPWAWTVA